MAAGGRLCKPDLPAVEPVGDGTRRAAEQGSCAGGLGVPISSQDRQHRFGWHGLAELAAERPIVAGGDDPGKQLAVVEVALGGLVPTRDPGDLDVPDAARATLRKRVRHRPCWVSTREQLNRIRSLGWSISDTMSAA